MVQEHFNSEYPSGGHLMARGRMPGFAYGYLAGGCFSEVNLERNTRDLKSVQLRPRYPGDFGGACQETELFRKKICVSVRNGAGRLAGDDVAAALASGADFMFMRRLPMFGVCALGKHGGHHTFEMVK